MASSNITHLSKMVSDMVKYKWIISDFSVKNFLEGVKSPSFQIFSIDFHLELSYDEQFGKILLVQSASDDPPRITFCEIGFYCSKLTDEWYSTEFIEPKKITDISVSVSVAHIKKNCLADNKLRVGCTLTASKLKHTFLAHSETKTTDNDKTVLKQAHKTLAENLGNILDYSQFSDVSLKVGEETIPVHKAILAGRSAVFEGMFKSDMKESKQNIVEIAEMKPAIMRKILRYIYAGTVEELSMDTAIDLYVGSDRYDLQELKGWCKEFILENISSDDVCRVAVIADLHSDEELVKASRRTFKKNPKLIVGSEAWRAFKKENASLHSDLLESALIRDD